MQVRVKHITNDDTNALMFIIETLGVGEKLYISKAQVHNEEERYLTNDKSEALLFFSRQDAEGHLNSTFKFVKKRLNLVVNTIPVNDNEKRELKVLDKKLQKEYRIQKALEREEKAKLYDK